jgi:hypothetical protein
VAAGGRIVAAGRTGFPAGAGGDASWGECALRCIGLGLADRVLADSRASYAMLDEEPLEALPETRCFAVHGAFGRGRPRDGAEALYPVQRGLYGPPEKVQWWDDPADSPVWGEYGAYRMELGEGETVYFPFDLGALYWRYYQSAHRELIAHWVRRFLAAAGDGPRVCVHGAPLAVQLSVHRIGESADVLVHLLNYSGCQRNHAEMPLPVAGLTLFGTGSPSRVAALGSGRELEVHRGPGEWSAAAPELRLFEAYLIEEML